MIKLARQRSTQYLNIDFQVADVLAWDFPEGQFDCVVSIATLHHLPLESILQKMKFALKTGGVLLALDLYRAEGVGDLVKNLLAIPVHVFLRLKNTGRIRNSKEARKAWTAHSLHDTYLPVSEVRRICRDLLPGVSLKKHLLWRYSIVWKK